MKMFAIYHIPTKKFMPAKMFRTSNRGHTFWEPTNLSGLGGHTKLPRLFSSKSAATCAMNHWLRGPIDVEKQYDFDGEGNYKLIPNKPLAPRNPEDVKVVTILLTKQD